jgi:hypothetical protein
LRWCDEDFQSGTVDERSVPETVLDEIRRQIVHERGRAVERRLEERAARPSRLAILALPRIARASESHRRFGGGRPDVGSRIS